MVMVSEKLGLVLGFDGDGNACFSVCEGKGRCLILFQLGTIRHTICDCDFHGTL